MAKIPLRAYLKEIEGYIERGEVDQAIAHAKNIIHNFPKQIDAYRLVGKAYLESQRLSEASDILQRVLSVIPDDFIAQVGMSIIREDEGNLDSAIWHMERAYEVQPFNPAVQDELRRLYGRRDGIEPPKIRLTRGALIRMYLRGELYPQAIAETRATLADDPQRYDLMVLLARLYYLSGQILEATEICSSLISKLPYCLEANQILCKILPRTSRADDVVKFQQRIIALDPYSAFITPASPTSDMVPEQAVMVDHYAWPSAEGEQQAPEWARTIGVRWEEPEADIVPEWMSSLQENPVGQPASGGTTPETLEETAQGTMPVETPSSEEKVMEPNDLVPDFMKDAGWKASGRPADEIMASAEETDIEPANIPEWLQAIAPEQPGESGSESKPADQIEDIFSGPGTGVDKFEWLSEPGLEEETESEAETPGPELPQEETQPGASPTDLVPDWLMEYEVHQSATEKLEAASPVGPPPAPDLSDMDAALARLEGLAAKQGADEAALATSPEERLESPPDWVKQEMEASRTDIEEPIKSELEIDESAMPVPDWASMERDVEGIKEAPIENAPAEVTGFAQIEAIQDSEETEPSPQVEAAGASEPPIPDWLSDLKEESLAQEKEPTSTQPTEPEIIEPETEDLEALPEWLSGKEGALTGEEASLTTSFELSNEWLSEAPIEQTTQTTAVSESEPQQAVEATVSAAEEPSQPVEIPPASLSLGELKEALMHGNIDHALAGFGEVIHRGENLPETIQVLRDALYRFPVDISIWQALGDAYARNDQLQEALNAYTKAEELLR
jgi:tetratricopeptide (TPR) repeat protein